MLIDDFWDDFNIKSWCWKIACFLALWIRQLNCGPGKGLNEDYGSYVKIDTWTPVLRVCDPAREGPGIVSLFWSFPPLPFCRFCSSPLSTFTLLLSPLIILLKNDFHNWSRNIQTVPVCTCTCNLHTEITLMACFWCFWRQYVNEIIGLIKTQIFINCQKALSSRDCI